MRSDLVVVLSPELDSPLSVGQVGKPGGVEAFVSWLAVEALNVTVLGRLPSIDKVQRDLVFASPGVEHDADEFRPVVDADVLWLAADRHQQRQRRDDTRAR